MSDTDNRALGVLKRLTAILRNGEVSSNQAADTYAVLRNALIDERRLALEEAEKAVRALNDPMENSGYMYEIAADVVAALRDKP